MPTPAAGHNASLVAVNSQSASNAWAVGHYSDTANDTAGTYTLHWNGTSWKHVASPN
jgi:hypothetical protein